MDAEVPSLVCPDCGTANEPAFAYCSACGTSLRRTCPSCGSPAAPSAAFCGTCGARLTAAQPESPTVAPPERKLVSVLFADLEASTELATRLDPEELRGVYAPYFESMSAVIERFGGTVEKFIGDAVVGVFGVPVAHEDDPIRAVRAGLAMQSALSAIAPGLAASVGTALAMRIAVHTGEVLATPGHVREALVTGETTSVAARLQSVAPSGSVVVSERTYRDARRAIGFESLGSASLKGVAQPVMLYRAVEQRPEEPAAFASPLVGRTEERELIHVLLRRTTRERQPSLVTILGIAGIGKSRLAAAVAEAAERGEIPGVAPCRVLRGRCPPYEDGIALWPFAEILKADAGILDSDPVGSIPAKARSSLGARPELGGSPTLEILLSSLGIATDTDPLSGADRDAAGRMIADAWRRYFTSIAAAQPVVALIEDIHWADRSLLGLLETMAARVQGPVLFLCLARPELLEAHPTWGAGLTAAATLGLPPLTSDEERVLFANLVGGAIEPALERALTERSAGNPFFAGELVRMLIEEGAIERRDGAWAAAGDISARLPDTVQAVIAARIDRLDPEQKRAIQDASVVGRVFWDGAVTALGSGDRSRALDGLIDRGLVREQRSSSIEGTRELRFEHVVIKDVAYGSIPKGRRPGAHRAVVDWIETVTRGRDEEFSELMAHHASIAGDPERTARYAILAGHRHRRVFAAEEAIRWYDRALDAARELSGETALLLAEIALSRGEALEQLGRFDDALADYEGALARVRSAERGRGWLESNILAAIVHVTWLQDRYEESRRLIPGALEVARSSGMPDVVARLLYEAGAIAWSRADWTGARSSHRAALEVAEAAGDLEGQAYARHGLTETGLQRGPLEDAVEEAERSRSLWLRLGWRPMLHRSGELLGWLLVLLGRLGEAEVILDETLAGQRELGQRRDEASTLVPTLLAELARGRLGAALAHADQAVDIASTVGAPRAELVTCLFRALLHAELRAPDLAEADLRRAGDVGDQLGLRLLRPGVLAARGWLRVEAGDRDAANDSFSAARREAGDGILHRLVCGWFEIRARAIDGDPSELREVGRWVLDSDTDPGPATTALALWALARADALDGKGRPAHDRALEALRLAERAGDQTVRWRAAATAAETAGDPSVRDDLRRTASSIVRAIADTLDEAGLRERFLAQPALEGLV